jgi:hypothetical protein
VPSLIISLVIPAILFMAHYKYIDLWFGSIGGLKAYWIGQRSTIAIVSKALFVVAILLGALLGFDSHRLQVSIGVAVAFMGHYALIAMLPRNE